MNIILDEKEHDYLYAQVIRRFVIGSRLYGVHNENSDSDYLCIYPASEVELHSGLPNFHQFQYKDKENNIDYIYSSELQFWKNLYNGDSTINADVILFTDFRQNKLDICRTYKIIKAYLGFARRDSKQIHKEAKKINHIARGLYCASELLQGRLPEIAEIQKIYKKEHNIQHLIELEKEVRAEVNEQYDSGKLSNFYTENCGNALWQKLLDSNNTREFRY